MKRYLLFTYADYYPCGGWTDFNDSFDTIEEAKNEFTSCNSDQYDLIDTTTWERLFFDQ